MAFNIKQPAYERLRTAHAERRSPLVFWTGAGLSQPAGLPGWPQLRDVLLARGLEAAALLPEPEGKAKEAALEAAARCDSLWDSFQILKKEIGPTEFREEIRSIFSGVGAAEVPDVYRAIWELPGVRGILTLNMDEFAAKSHKRTRFTEDPAVFFGRDAPDYAHILAAGRSFIGNLHGTMDAQKSWVFTRDEISALTATPGYKEFITLVFAQMTVVFVGISAEDRAAGSFLEQLTNLGLDLGAHYWITDRTDGATHGWASKAGVSVIRYSPIASASGPADHTSPLLELLADMREFVSRDTAAEPLIPNVTSVEKLPPQRELRTRDEDEIRSLLSGYAKNLLGRDSAGTRAAYESFLDEYAPSIHQAWYITDREPYNLFYGFRVGARISTSPFSTIWKLVDSKGAALALKVLRIENLFKGPEIESFRRGINSLTFLTNADVPGSCKLVDAYEIPTSLIMEFVEGSNLQEIAGTKGFDPWDDGLAIIANVCTHLKFAHNLPQGVLHRDVRPSNIMVPNFFWQDDFLEGQADKHAAKLLNYDMSWHIGAKGQTISGNLEESGYYAPEQSGAAEEWARTTLVDSYGVGMCLYYIFARRPPPTAGSKSVDWPAVLSTAFRANPRLRWRSAPARVRRLVERATSSTAADRLAIDQIGAEVSLIRNAVRGATHNLPADYWAEELMSRSEQAEYVTLSGGTSFVREPRQGRMISIAGDIRENSVVLSFKNQALASTNRSGLDRMWSDKLQRAREILAASGWNVREESRYGNMEILLAADVAVSELRARFDPLLEGVKKGLDQVRIE